MKTVKIFDSNKKQIGYVKSFRGAKFTGYVKSYSAITNEGNAIGISQNSFDAAKKLLESYI